jgi:carbon-monoxide dehydrogenase medium subunit
MYNFDYHRPEKLADAAALLAANPDAKLLAGGQTLIPTLKQRLAMPTAMIDLGKIAELRGITVTADKVRVGAMTRHAEVANAADVAKAIPALAALAGVIGDPHVRHMGTIGGSLANNDPAADYPAAALALGATLVTSKRSIAAADYFQGLFTTALEADEILVAIEFPRPRHAGYAKFRNPASRYAVVGVFVAETAAGVRVAVTGAAPCVFRSKELEAALGKSFSPGAIAGVAIAKDGLNSDFHASAAYRAHLVTVMAQQAVEKALSP